MPPPALSQGTWHAGSVSFSLTEGCRLSERRVGSEAGGPRLRRQKALWQLLGFWHPNCPPGLPGSDRLCGGQSLQASSGREGSQRRHVRAASSLAKLGCRYLGDPLPLAWY